MSKVITDKDEIKQVLSRSVAEIIPGKEELIEKMASGERLSIYQGYDPTAKDLHIGHAIGMRFLEKFRQLGHEVIFLIGTGTGKVGDPTDKNATRSVLSDDQIEENIHGWIEQASQILDFENNDNPVKILKNGDWLKPMTLNDFLEIGNNVTVQQLLERDMFKKRLEAGKPISISEMLYPILQGYDSVAMEVDIELGGSDQLFNMMMGRTLEKSMLNKEKFVITLKLLEDPNGVKMGKSLGNTINLTDSANDIYGKVMSFTDGMIAPGFEILTEMPLTEVNEIREKISKNKINPMEYKKKLAFAVTEWIKDEEAAKAAEKHFEKTVQGSQISEDRIKISKKKLINKLESIDRIGDLSTIVAELAETSKSQAKTLIKQGAVEINKEKITDKSVVFEPEAGDIIKVGKRNWFEIVD